MLMTSCKVDHSARCPVCGLYLEACKLYDGGKRSIRYICRMHGDVTQRRELHLERKERDLSDFEGPLAGPRG